MVNISYRILLDPEDTHILNKYSWCISTGYVRRCEHVYIDKNKYSTRVIYLHRHLMNAIKGQVVDHINGNPLDNRKENLRIVTQQINTRNKRSSKGSTSKYVGVYYHKQNKRWAIQIRIDGKVISFPTYKTEEEAKEIRNKYIIDNQLYGFKLN